MKTEVRDKAEVMNEILAYSTGTEAYHKINMFSPVVVTDGIMAMCQNLGAFWLVDAILSYRRAERFQIWSLNVGDRSAVLEMREDAPEPVKVQQVIEWTDFPQGNWKFWLVDGVLMLPTEY